MQANESTDYLLLEKQINEAKVFQKEEIVNLAQSSWICEFIQ